MTFKIGDIVSTDFAVLGAKQNIGIVREILPQVKVRGDIRPKFNILLRFFHDAGNDYAVEASEIKLLS